MVALPHRQRLNLPLAPLLGGAAAMLVALVVALLPGDVLGGLALDSGIAALVPAAEPPLGATARAVLIIVGGGGVGLAVWFTLYLLIGARAVSVSGRTASSDAVPVLRRADAHPDAPPRRPLFANQDLGTPFLDVRAPDPAAPEVVAERPPAPPVALERDIPSDLDLPLSAFDPHAVPMEPLAWSPAPVQAPRPQVFDVGERFETFELTPMVRPAAPVSERPAPVPRADDDASPSIHALLDRLERGVVRAPATPVAQGDRPDGLRDAIVSLRRLATNG